MENQARLQEIFQRYINNEASPEEVKLLLQYFDSEDQEALHELIANELNKPVNLSELGGYDQFDKVYNEILERIQEHKTAEIIPLWRRLVPRIAAAALLLAVFSLSLYWYTRPVNDQLANEQPQKSEIVPGGSKAVLILADGSSVALDTAMNGILAHQGNTEIKKTREGLLEYDANSSQAIASKSALNTIITPRGGEYRLILPDGTKVWLNAASSLKFPAGFDNNERKVELEGEAYFEVASRFKPNGKREKVPFIVKTANQEVKVLGTHFNIKAYADESETRTTLLEGSVRVTVTQQGSNSQSSLLVPGQQALLRTSGNVLSVSRADLEQAVAWKNGYFKFQREDIRSVMRQISRWYNVDIEYRGKVTEEEFGGKISRNENITGVLQILKLSNVKCRIEGKKIIIGN